MPYKEPWKHSRAGRVWPKAPMGVCGHPTRNPNGICRKCRGDALRRERGLNTHCLECGERLGTSTTLKGGALCRSCWTKQHSTGQTVCSMEGCDRPFSARGLCLMHYRVRWQQERGISNKTSDKVKAGRLPCQICGYERMRSHIHRLDGKAGYVLGNMTALCARCHDEVHRGLTPVPPPLTAKDIARSVTR